MLESAQTLTNQENNHHQLQRLMASVQASFGRLNLLIGVCDNWKYRDELICTYERELESKGVKFFQVRIESRQISLKDNLLALVAQEPTLQSGETKAVITVLGADALLGLRLHDPKSAQERFFFSLQWTRESLRQFQVPIVLWLTPKIASALADQAPDFWSWRGGVFEFSQPMSWGIRPEQTGEISLRLLEQPERVAAADPVAIQQEIDALEAEDPHSPLLPSLYTSLGRAYVDAIRYPEAEAPYLQALQLYEQQLGADHPDVATSLNNLAGLYESQGRYSDAEPLYLRSLEIDRKVYGEDHPEIATDLNNLANLYQSQGRYSDAEPLYLRSQAIYEPQLGADHPSVATSLNNLAELYRVQGRYSDAEPLYLGSLVIRVQQLGADHPSVATSLNNLALLYRAQGRYSEAESLRLRCLEIERRTLGEAHPQFAASLNNLAGLYESQGRYSEAEPLYLRSQAIREQQLGTDHPDVATSLNNLALLYKSQGRYSDAEPLYLRSLDIKEKRLGSDHPSTKLGWNNFKSFLQQVISENRIAELSDNPITQGLLTSLLEQSE